MKIEKGNVYHITTERLLKEFLTECANNDYMWNTGLRADKSYKSLNELKDDETCIEINEYGKMYYGTQQYYMTYEKRTPIEYTGSSKEYKLIVEDPYVTLISPDGKTAIAKCHPDDEFDVFEGIRVAATKLEALEAEITDKEANVLLALYDLGCDYFRIDSDYEEIDGYCDDQELVTFWIDQDTFNYLEPGTKYYIDDFIDIED